MSPIPPIEGHCFCQKIRFKLFPPTDFCSHCHCESCRRSHGSAFVTWTSVPNDQLEITLGKDLIKSYESSPGIEWLSCQNCATPLFQTTRYSPGRTYVGVANLSSPLDREPDSHVSFEEHVPWLKINDGLPQYKEKASDRLES